MAAQIKSELNVDAEMVHGRYGEFKIQVDGETVVDGGGDAVPGILPSANRIVEAVRGKLTDVD